MKCFAYGESGHWQSEYKKASKRTLFAEINDGKDTDAAIKEQPAFDEEQSDEEEVLTSDVGAALIVQRSCLTPKAVTEDD